MARRAKRATQTVPWRALVLVWTFATALNLLKPFHLDDTAHLLIAQHILTDPLHPLSGALNWLNVSEPIFVTNQPHFFFYLIAAVMWLAGPSELALHLLVAAFTFAALLLVYRLAQRLVPEHSLLLTVAAGISPGFLINQNVMVDIPLLAMICLSVLMLSRTPASGRAGAIGFASFSAALLTKYTALFLYPALIWAALQSRKTLVWAWLPIAALAGWSLFNIYDFGAAHILNRPSIGRGLVPSPKLAIALAAAMGAFATPLAAMLMLQDRWRWRWLWCGLWAAAVVGYTVIWALAVPGVSLFLLAANGILFAGTIVLAVAAGLRVLAVIWSLWQGRGNLRGWFADNLLETTLILWLAGGALFLTLFPPFMATRHALLLMPPLFILALRGRTLAPARWHTYAVFALWGLFGAFVVGNDIAFARFYAQSAPVTARIGGDLAGASGTVYTRGHWGWQWYAHEHGMSEYDTELSQPRIGDVLVDPVGISAQQVNDLDSYVVAQQIRQPASVFTLLDTHGFYAAGATPLPLITANPGRVVRVLKKVK